MTDEATTAFLAALLGAIVGGGASFLGSVFVGRGELTREARQRLFLELLPSLPSAGLNPGDPPLRSVVEEIDRVAVAASWRDARQARHLMEAMTAYRAEVDAEVTPRPANWDELNNHEQLAWINADRSKRQAAVKAARARVIESGQAFETSLRKRLR